MTVIIYHYFNLFYLRLSKTVKKVWEHFHRMKSSVLFTNNYNTVNNTVQPSTVLTYLMNEACEWQRIKPATHLAILYADRSEFDRQRKSRANFVINWCGHTGRFFTPIAAIWHFNFIPRLRPGHFPRSCPPFWKVQKKIAQPDWLTLVAIRSDERKQSKESGHTWRIPANLIADIWHASYRRFYAPIAAIGENRQVCPVQRLRLLYKIADIWHVRYRRLNSPAFAMCARSGDF